MFNLKHLSITKKIGLLSICAFIGMLLIISVGLLFFGKIEQIGGLKITAKTYEIHYHKASFAFEQYTQTRSADKLELFIHDINEMNSENGALPKIEKMLRQHGNADDVYKAYVQQYKQGEGLHEAINLVKALNGKPVLDKLVTNCENANKLTMQWLQIARKWNSTSESDQAVMLSQVNALKPKLEKLLSEFHLIVDEIMHSLRATVTRVFVFLAVITMLVLLAVTVIVVRFILKPLKATGEFVQAISSGDLTRTIDIIHKDELGQMCGSLNQMNKDLAQMLGEIRLGIETLSSSSTELSAISDQLMNDTQETSGKASEVARDTDDMSESMTAVTSAMAEANDNTSVVAAAAEQMSGTIDKISKNAEQARVMSENANGRTNEATVRMNELGQAAEGIGKVIETITDISEQVNLLALNATIEAARAGEAGKGFAVVANEIKELARQTAEATQDIKEKIQTIQTTTSTTISETQEVTGVIGQLNEVISDIARAIEEQSAATREIAANINKTAYGIETISSHVTNTSSAAGRINTSISEVNQSAAQMAESSGQVNMSSAELASLAEKLTGMVARFKC